MSSVFCHFGSLMPTCGKRFPRFGLPIPWHSSWPKNKDMAANEKRDVV